MYDEDLVSIGVIRGAYGLRGEVRVAPLTDFPERFNKMEKVFVVGPGVRTLMNVENTRTANQTILFKFQGIDSRETAEGMRGRYLMVPENEVYPLPEGSYYYFQLKGLQVYDQELGYLGILQDILETGANDVYSIKSEEYGEILIPAIKEVVLKVDLEKKEMQIKLLPGLLD